MGHDQRGKDARRTGVSAGTKTPYIAPPPKVDHNERRRAMYAASPEYAEQQRSAARRAYRESRNKSGQASQLANGLLLPGTLREVYVDGMEFPTTIECYTVPEAAKALGKSELTFKRWLDTDLIPAPVLRDTSRMYRQYSVGELRILAALLAEHEREFSYYAVAHTAMRERIMQGIFGFRMHSI